MIGYTTNILYESPRIYKVEEGGLKLIEVKLKPGERIVGVTATKQPNTIGFFAFNFIISHCPDRICIGLLMKHRKASTLKIKTEGVFKEVIKYI